MDKGECWVLSTVYAQLNSIIIALDLTQSKLITKQKRNFHLAACDSVYEACDELWIQRQAFHYVDGFTRNSLVIYRQLVQPWRTNKEAHENIGTVSITNHILLLLVNHHFYVVIFFPFSFSVCWTLQISPLGFRRLPALYIICHPSYFCIYFKVCKQTK